MTNPRSTFSIGGHPIHPMVVPFPIALFVSALATDIVYIVTGDPAWAGGSFWLIVGGLVMALIAALGGLIDFMGDSRIRETSASWLHAVANVAVVIAEAFSLYFRYKHGADAVLPVGVVLSAIAALLLVFSGWQGGELVYKHRVAVRD
jgi:uncharacterized membrane protein